MCFSVQLFLVLTNFMNSLLHVQRMILLIKKDYNNLKHKIRLKILKLDLLSKKLLKT